MYLFLTGQVVEKVTEPSGSEKLILNVSGIGFEIYTTLPALEVFGKKGEITTVYTTLVHREDTMTLFGFPTLIERELFNLLCSVSGIGPKTALNLLGNLTVSEISYSILNEDITSLKRAQGIGERTANRIILELKEKIKNWKYLTIAYSKPVGALHATPLEKDASIEARSILQSLGYSNTEITQAITVAKENDNNKTSEELVHFALKCLSGRGNS